MLLAVHKMIFSQTYLVYFLESHGEEEDDEAEEDEERDEAEEVGEGNDRPYNLRQRKTVQRYEAPPIGKEKH